MAVMTKIVANVTRHETVIYYVDGAVDRSQAVAVVESGEYEPDDSRIQHEDVEIVECSVRS